MEIRIFGLKRSGLHGIMNWVATMLPDKVWLFNNLSSDDQIIEQVIKNKKKHDYSIRHIENEKYINTNNLNNNSKLKGRLSKNIRSSIGSWQYSYWLDRLEQKCEDNRVSFRSVCPSHTSQKCCQCGHIDRGNRHGEIFRCLKCDHSGNADVNAALNILERFLSGPYGAAYKPKIS